MYYTWFIMKYIYFVNNFPHILQLQKGHSDFYGQYLPSAGIWKLFVWCHQFSIYQRTVNQVLNKNYNTITTVI